MRLSQKAGSVSLELGFWWDEKDQAIHLTSNDKETGTFHVAVRHDPSKNSGHPYLFRELAKCLRAKGVPAPEEPESSN